MLSNQKRSHVERQAKSNQVDSDGDSDSSDYEADQRQHDKDCLDIHVSLVVCLPERESGMVMFLDLALAEVQAAGCHLA